MRMIDCGFSFPAMAEKEACAVEELWVPLLPDQEEERQSYQ